MFSHKNENDGAELRVELDTVSGKHQVTVIDANGRDSHAKFHPEATRALAKKLGEAIGGEELANAKKIILGMTRTSEERSAELNRLMQENAAAKTAVGELAARLERGSAECAKLDAENAKLVNDAAEQVGAYERKIAELQAALAKDLKVEDVPALAKNPFDAMEVE